MNAYRWMFFAAAIYNVLWGAMVVAFPLWASKAAGLTGPECIPLVQVVGMMVGVYGYGYYLLSRDPQRYCGLVWVGLAGKTLGPIGFLFSASTGSLPWSFGWVCVFNDIIWWPGFWSFALRHSRRPLS